MDSDLLTKIYRAYAREIYLYLYSLCNNKAMAEDLMQEVFVKAMCSLPESHSNFRAWLYRVAKNLCMNEIKRCGRQVLVSDTSDVVDTERTQQKDSVLEQMLQTEKERILYDGLQQLDWRQREILTLQYFSGFSAKQIAFFLKLTPENVRILAHRGRKQLKEYMEEHGYEIS